MNIILTDYGVSQLNETKKPLQITKYKLGTGYAYNPSSSQTGLKGSEVYSNTVEGPNIINANVYQYSVMMDYNVGPFFFGEIAYYDANNECVAISVSENTIEKRAMRNANSGNSLRLDAYLSMVGGTYNTWADSIGSDIKFQIPILETIDNLPPVKDSDPNCYIVSPMSVDSSSTLVYSAGDTGLWHFDCYQFSNMRVFTVKSATSTTVTLDATNMSAQEKQDLIPLYAGDKVVEFSSGQCYSICRVVKSVAVQSKSVTISFRTPLAIEPAAGDTVLYFSRTEISRNTMTIPIATPDTIGGVKPSDANFIVDLDGTLHLSFDPVKSVNGLFPDEDGNVTIPAYEAKTFEQDDLDNLLKMGVYFANGKELENCPSSADDLTIEVLDQGEGKVVQRVTDNTKTWWRSFDGDTFTDWRMIFSNNNPMNVGMF